MLPTTAFAYLHLSYRPDLEILFLRWTRPVSSEEHRAGYSRALEMAQAEGASHWLIDLRSRGLASAEDFMWVLTDFRQLLTQALPGSAYRVAYLVAPYHQQLISSRIQNQDSFRVFTEEAPAQQWLSAPQPSAHR